MAYHKIAPFGAKRDDLRAGLMTFWLRDAWVNGDTRAPKDFALQFEEDEELTEGQQIMQEIRNGVA